MVTKLYNFILTCAGCCLAVAAWGQQAVDYARFSGTPVKTEIQSRLDAPYFKSYGSEVLEVYIKINIARNPYPAGPEAVLYAVYRAPDNETLNRVVTGSSKTSLVSFKKQSNQTDTARNFLRLRHKLTFTTQGKEVAIIAYTQYVDSAAAGNYVLQTTYTKGQWRGTMSPDYADLAIALRAVSTEEFWSLHKKNDLDENDAPVPAGIRERVKDADGVLNLTKLANLIREKERQGKTWLTP